MSKLNPKNNCPLIKDKSESDWVYFVHSFAAIPSNKIDLAASTNFGDFELTAIVWRENIGACQFHPEKSSLSGQKILVRWLTWIENNFGPVQ